MSYTIIEQRDLYGVSGYAYHVEINGLAAFGWRAGTREQVESYARDADRLSTERAAGQNMRYSKDGRICMSHLSGARISAKRRKKKAITMDASTVATQCHD